MASISCSAFCPPQLLAQSVRRGFLSWAGGVQRSSNSTGLPNYSLAARKISAVRGMPTMSNAENSSKSAQSKSRSQKKNPSPVYLRKTGMNTPVVLTNELRDFIGKGDIMNRSQIMSDIGKYLKEQNLYTKKKNKTFVCDHRLSAILKIDGEHRYDDLHRLLGPLISKPSELGPEYETRADKYFEDYLKQRGAVALSSTTPRGSRSPDRRGKNSSEVQKRLRESGQGMFARVYIHPSLRQICGGEEYMSRPDVLKSVWNYIKDNKLQDPVERRQVCVSDTLRDALQLPDIKRIDCFHIGRFVFKLTSKSPP